jgi:mono/diheme cytochrome c family protein
VSADTPGAASQIDVRAIPRAVEDVFAAHCVACHGPAKTKGDLRLDDAARLFGGDPSTWAVRPGDPDSGELLRRVALGAADEGAMPPDGPRITADEIARLRTWIVGGCRGDDAPERAAASPLAAAAPPSAAVAEDSAAEDVAGPWSAAELAAAAALRALGGRVEPVSAGGPGLDVNLSFAGRRFGDADLAALTPLVRRVHDLNLAGTGVGEGAADVLGDCAHLRRLSLQETGVGDGAARRLALLPRLVSLNLFGTRITDAGLDALGASSSLRRIYVWRTEASPAAIARLRALRSTLQVDGGTESAEPQAASK